MQTDGGEGDGRLHVAIVSFGLDGGMAQYSAMLTNELAGLVDVTVITPESQETRSLFSDGVTLRTVEVVTEGGSPLASISTNLAAFVAVQKHVYEADADIVHVPFVAGFPSALSTVLLCLHQHPIVGTVHDPKSHTGQEVDVLGVDLKETLGRLCARSLDRVIVHGEESRRQARALGYPMDRVRVLPHGLYTHFEQFDTGEVQEEENTLLFFGTIRPNKGFDRIPELLDRVSEEVPDVRAIVAGSPEVPPQVDSETVERTVARLDAHDRVELHNRYIPNEEVGALFERATLVVLPYYDATASGVAMAAYTFETPIVATRTGDLGRTVEGDGSGLLADPGATPAIASQITRLLEDDALRQECTGNIREVKDDYSWAQIASETVALYRETIDSQ